MKKSSRLIALLLLTLFIVATSAVPDLPLDDDDELVLYYYRKSCPKLEKIIHEKVSAWMKNDYTIGPAIMRLHFHDCSVRGCDASILLDYPGSERVANASKSLRGFELIDEIKREVEKVCPKTVSCADILTAAARDATVLAGGPFWSVPYGRKDGRVSLAKEADQYVPMGHEKVTDLIEYYQSKGLNIVDMVVLSGAHTIGRATCGSMQYRLFNFEGTGKPDPSINPKYLNYLKRKCRWASEYVDLDAETPKKFDVQHFKNLQNKMGLLKSDQLLYSDSRTRPLVDALASQNSLFRHQFAVSMVKLGNIQDYYSADEGEIRVQCSKVNPSY